MLPEIETMTNLVKSETLKFYKCNLKTCINKLLQMEERMKY